MVRPDFGNEHLKGKARTISDYDRPSLVETARNTMLFSEIVSIAVDSFRTSKVRFALTALGMVIGTASLIMVITIGLTGKQYVMNQIQAIGANLIYAYYEGGSNASVNTGVRDDLTVEDMQAVQQEVPGIQAASPMLEMHDRIGVGGGKERDILVLGVSPQYSTVRNLEILAGRFFDDEDSMSRAQGRGGDSAVCAARLWRPERGGGPGHQDHRPAFRDHWHVPRAGGNVWAVRDRRRHGPDSL